MKLPVVSFVGLIVAVCTIAATQLFGTQFSREDAVRMYHNTFHIEQRTSLDGQFSLVMKQDQFSVSPVTRAMNKNRTLRATVFVSRSPETAEIVVERAGDKATYVLHGPFFIAPQDVKLHFVSPVTISFVAIDTKGSAIEYVVDLLTLSHTEHSFTTNDTPPYVNAQSDIID